MRNIIVKRLLVEVIKISDEIISGLRDMNFYHIPAEGYVPTYTRTDFTDALHDSFGFRTDTEIVSKKEMRNIFKYTKLRTF